MKTQTIFTSILETIGHTPLARLSKLGQGLNAEILVKVESLNPGGSIKDRVAARIIATAEREGLLKPGGTIIEATAGNTGVGLAQAAAVRGYRCIFVLPDKMSPDKINLLRAYGAEVVITPTAVPPDSPESYNGVAERLTREIPGTFRAAQFENPENPAAHYETTGPEIWDATGGRVDVLVAAIGTGGTISGTGRYLKEKKPQLVVVGADPEGSILSGDAPKPWKVEGIGEDFIPRTFDRQVVDTFIRIGDRESFATARRLAREEGILAGGSAGTALAAALRYAQRLTEHRRIVVILPDTGRNYLTKFYADSWLEANGLQEGETKRRRTVGDVTGQSRVLPTIIAANPEHPVDAALQLLQEYGISQLPVLENGVMVGSLHESTLMHLAFSGKPLHQLKIREVMARPFPVLEAGTDLEEAYRLLLSGHGAILVTRQGVPAQVVTRTDLLRFQAQEGQP